MNYRTGRLSIVLFVAFLVSGFNGVSVIRATTVRVGDQDAEWQQDPGPDRRERGRLRREERQELTVVRELDREHRLRFRMNNQVKAVGYIDNFGTFHFYGYYDPWGFFHRY